MSKYISKDDAVLAIARHEMYEAETEYPYASDDIEDWKEVGERILANVQDADVVEVVRCKDCKFYVEHSLFGVTQGWCERLCDEFDRSMAKGTGNDDFCSHGEKKVTE